jgi:GNAT superfamily N-acetyltransferase
MIELPPTHFAAVAPLLAGLGDAVLPRAVLEGFNPGWVFVDEPLCPASALIGLPCGYFFAAGCPPQPALRPGLAALIQRELVGRSSAAGNFGFLFSFGAPGWVECLPDLLPARQPLRIFRRGFHFDPLRFGAMEQALAPLPAGLRLERVDASALQAFPELRVEVNANWRSPDDFLRSGLGVYIARGAELACWCLSPFACQDALEISVVTAPAFRRQGLARQASAAFLRLCLAAGRRPNWECFWDNQPSLGLALSLGFTFAQDTPVFYWEELPSGLA